MNQSRECDLQLQLLLRLSGGREQVQMSQFRQRCRSIGLDLSLVHELNAKVLSVQRVQELLLRKFRLLRPLQAKANRSRITRIPHKLTELLKLALHVARRQQIENSFENEQSYEQKSLCLQRLLEENFSFLVGADKYSQTRVGEKRKKEEPVEDQHLARLMEIQSDYSYNKRVSQSKGHSLDAPLKLQPTMYDFHPLPTSLHPLPCAKTSYLASFKHFKAPSPAKRKRIERVMRESFRLQTYQGLAPSRVSAAKSLQKEINLPQRFRSKAQASPNIPQLFLEEMRRRRNPAGRLTLHALLKDQSTTIQKTSLSFAEVR